MCSPPVADILAIANDGRKSPNPRLSAVHCIECLIEEETNGKGVIHPGWHILVHGRIIPEHSQKVDYDEAEAGESDLV